ncbi:MAG: hypothetical protein ACKV2Q_36705 [Planctomycetaceae bacterium]
MFMSKDERTPEYIGVIDAIRRLNLSNHPCAKFGDAAQRAAAEALYDVHDEAIIRHWGWKPANAESCLHRVARGRCKYRYCDNRCKLPSEDHPVMYSRGRGTYLYLSQPYGMTLESVRETVEKIDAIGGLNLYINTYPAPHFPGSVLSVIVVKAGVALHNPQKSS